jgi:hypothetical protein
MSWCAAQSNGDDVETTTVTRDVDDGVAPTDDAAVSGDDYQVLIG